MKELLEYKMDANDHGNLIHPNWIDHTDCGHFYNENNHTYVGVRLSPKVKVPDSVAKLTKEQLITRCKIPGIMVNVEVDGEEVIVTQMPDLDIEAAINQFCEDREIT